MSAPESGSTGTASVRLFACPFCGSPPRIWEPSAGSDGYKISCVGEDCFGPRTTAYHFSDCLRQWNRRPTHDEIVKALLPHVVSAAQRPVDSDALTQNADLERRCIAAIETQNWTDQALTEEEKNLIGMAVGWTANVMRDLAYTSPVGISQLDDASNACLELAAKYGFATGHGDTVADMIREFSPQIAALTQKIDAEARRYAEMYPQSSDGRNTFLIFADWVSSLSSTEGDGGRSV